MQVTERGKPVPNIDDKRNEQPAERRTEAADDDSACGLNALLAAETRAHRRVGHKNSVSRFHMLAMSKCNEISNTLKSHTYKPQKGEIHEVFEPKHRITVSAKYCDRVPQASFIVNCFYPLVVPHLILNNCACIKGRGVDYARKIFKRTLREAELGNYCLKTDMKQYFASIPHNSLHKELDQYFAGDEYAMWFFRLTVTSTSKPTGLDLGSEVYQLSATSFLNKLDHAFDDGKYLRYQDDLIYIAPRKQCESVLEIIRAETSRLGLTISEKITFIQPIDRPVKFLGFSFWKHGTGRITMKRLPEKIRSERRKLKRMKKKRIPPERVESHYQSIRACLKKGARCDLMKLDRYKEKLFKGAENGNNQKGKHQP